MKKISFIALIALAILLSAGNVQANSCDKGSKIEKKYECKKQKWEEKCQKKEAYKKECMKKKMECKKNCEKKKQEYKNKCKKGCKKITE